MSETTWRIRTRKNMGVDSATDRQVSYIADLLVKRWRSGEGSTLISSLREDY